jgi:NADPH2:quinone reductase
MKSLRIVVRRLGGPEVLETVDEEAPEPAPGEARVRIIAAGVSFADLLMREGLHPERSDPPFTPGWDIVGTVDKLGEGAPGALLGQRVVAMRFMADMRSTFACPRTNSRPCPAAWIPLQPSASC